MNLESILIVFAASVVELWLGIPLGLVMEINPVLIIIFSATGAILSAIAITILGENLRASLVKWKSGDETALKETRMYNLWNKYGIIGLGFTITPNFWSSTGRCSRNCLGSREKRPYTVDEYRDRYMEYCFNCGRINGIIGP